MPLCNENKSLTQNFDVTVNERVTHKSLTQNFDVTVDERVTHKRMKGQHDKNYIAPESILRGMIINFNGKDSLEFDQTALN